MYGGFDVFKIYMAVKLHFTTDTYDYYKYGGKVNCKLDTFTKRNDRYFFHKLSTMYGKDDILDFFVSNFLADSKKWVGSLLRNDGKEVYLEYRKVKEAFEYNFRSDCVFLADDFNTSGISFDGGLLVHNGQHPRLLRLLLQKKIRIQTAVVLDNILSYCKNWSKEIKERVVWPHWENKIIKLKPFMSYNQTQCKLIMKEVFVNGK
tara:strand:- start:4595 stop:5209 length:615 start_codon:yes stop_codon:yes gene_type:complete